MSSATILLSQVCSQPKYTEYLKLRDLEGLDKVRLKHYDTGKFMQI